MLKALSKNPANRYQSAAEMRADLVRVLNGQAPLAPMVMSEDERTALLNRGPRTHPPDQRRGRPLTGAGTTTDGDSGAARRPADRGGHAAALVVAFVAGYLLFGGSSSPQQVTIPVLAGQQPEAARAASLIAAEPAPNVRRSPRPPSNATPSSRPIRRRVRASTRAAR